MLYLIALPRFWVQAADLQLKAANSARLLDIKTELRALYEIDYQNVSYFLQFFTYFQLDDFEEFPLLYSLKNRRETIFRVDR